MSEFLRAARDKLRAAVADIDARLVELQLEDTQLRDHRAQIVALIGEDVGLPSKPLEVAHASLTRKTPAVKPASPPASPSGRARVPGATGIFRVDAANRILAFLGTRARSSATGLATSAEVHAASEVSRPTTTRILADLLAAKRIVRTGAHAMTRYSPSLSERGQSTAAPADSEGDRGGRRAARR